MDNRQGTGFADVIRCAYPSAAVEHMRALANAGALVPAFQNALASLSANPEILKATMRAAEIQSRWSGQQVSEAITAVETLSRALSELPVERMNQLASAMAAVVEPLVLESSDADVAGGGQSMPIPVSFTVDVQRRVVRSEQITFDLQRIITNSALEPSAFDKLQEQLSLVGKDFLTPSTAMLLMNYFWGLVGYLLARGLIEESVVAATMATVFLLIGLICPQGK